MTEPVEERPRDECGEDVKEPDRVLVLLATGEPCGATRGTRDQAPPSRRNDGD